MFFICERGYQLSTHATGGGWRGGMGGDGGGGEGGGHLKYVQLQFKT